MTDNVVILPVITRLEIPAERVLNAAIEEGVKEVVIVGYDKDGEFYFASSKADGGQVMWLFELAKKKLLEIAD